MPTIHDRTNYHDINFGQMSLYRIGEFEVVARHGVLENVLEVQIVDIDKLPDFVRHLTLGIECNPHWSEVHMWVLKKEDLKPLGDYLSKTFRRVSILGCARYLSMWLEGKPTRHNKLEHFYSGLTPQQLEDYTY